jgi:hypothetical protein
VVELRRKLNAIGFDYRITEYELLTRVERVPLMARFQPTLRRIDYFILSKLPFLRHFARTAVIEIRKNR